MTIGELKYKITGDNASLKKNVADSDKQVKGLGKSIGTFSKLAIAGFTSVAVVGVAKISKELIIAASNAEETRNKFNVVFRDVSAEANAAAREIADGYGLSQQASEKYLSGVGDIVTGLGATSDEALLVSDTITRLGVDIDSFANLSGGAEQAVSALTSLFTGEREAAKALGIVINDTNLKAYAEDMGKIFKELTPLEKGFLSLELAEKQSTLAIGDFARSQDSFANQSKIAKSAIEDLKTVMGDGLLPIATRSVSIFAGLTRKLTEFIEERNRLREAEEAEGDGIATTEQRILLEQERLKEVERSIEAQERYLEVERASTFVGQGNIALYQENIRNLKEEKTGIEELIIRLEQGRTASKNLGRAVEENTEALDSNTEAGQENIEMIILQGMTAEEAIQSQYDKFNAINEARRDKERTTFAEKQFLIEAERQLKAEALEQERKDAEAYAELQRLKLTSVGGFFSGLAELSALGAQESLSLFNLNKGLASTEAFINSYLAYNKTLVDGGPFPFNVIAAGGILASGLAAQIKILSAKPPAFAGGGIVPQPPGVSSTGDNVLARLNPGEVVLNEAQQQGLVNSLSGGSRSGGQLEIIFRQSELFRLVQTGIDNQEIIVR